jgi:hypothetical protein
MIPGSRCSLFLSRAASGPALTHFSSTLYTGNGSARSITTGIDLSSGGMVWIKNRVATSDHVLADSVNGAGLYFMSDSTGQTTDAQSVTAFGNGTVSIGTSGIVNVNSGSFFVYALKRMAGVFDVVNYTGTGGSNAAFSHALGVSVGMAFILFRNVSNPGYVYHNSLGISSELTLDATSAAASSGGDFGTSAWTSTQFFVGGASANGSTRTYTAYLFAHDPSANGRSYCGSYTGNGSTSGPTVSIGWKPRMLLIKCTSSASTNLVMLDYARGFAAGSDALLFANSSNAETSSDYADPTSTGFQIKTTSADVNTSGATYAYWAVR